MNLLNYRSSSISPLLNKNQVQTSKNKISPLVKITSDLF